jgi:polyisoprenoid-binding protein YceI
VYPRDPDRSSGRLIVEVRSLKTDSNALNDNMYEMFDADQYPEIEYRIQRIELTGEEVIDTARLEGELQIRNVTRPLSASAELVEEDNGYTVSGELQIDYRRFGLEPPTAIFGLLNVDPPVDINYTVTFVEQE